MTRILRKKALLILLPLVALFALEISTLFMLKSPVSQEIRLSTQLESGPAIDTGAVMARSVGDSTEIISLCQSLPLGAWKLLLVVYVLLLVFNFREQYRTRGAVTTYVFEGGLTVFFLVEWLLFDTCRTETWFPLLLVKVGLILFLFFQIKGLIIKHRRD